MSEYARWISCIVRPLYFNSVLVLPRFKMTMLNRWVLASHAPVSTARVEQAVDEALNLSKNSDAILKHEPSIMHVRCVDLNWVGP